MKKFDEWWETYTIPDDSQFHWAVEDAFRAGMLAAADIVDDESGDSARNDYTEEWNSALHDIAEIIRKAADKG